MAVLCTITCKVHPRMVQVADERKPLAGLRIVEIGSLIAGPFAGRLLADFGAEVIKIEAPGKLDPLRSWGAGEINGNSPWWAVQSRGKRLITLNLRVPRGQRLLVDLLRQSDVLIENFRPGTLERWGLGPDVLLAENPKLVIARVSGEGETGPRSWRPGFALLESTIPDYDRFGVVRRPAGTGLANNVPSNLFRSRDERRVVIAANTDALFRRLAEAMARPGLAEDPRFATHAARSFNQTACEAEITAWTEQRDAPEIEQILSDAGIPTAPVNSVSELVRDEQLRARDMLLRQYDPDIGSYLTPGITPKLSETPGALTWSGRQTPGADNDLVFGELLGLSPDERAELAEEGIT
jgi:crotonobetainyl-CoA:carnitine CoA-transferase CaiB-like acyl-CoA transferase